MSFKKDFVWGVATASYQIEGGAYESDKGLNGWDVGCTVPGLVFEGHSGEVGCDHYHRFREDVALMKKLGYKNYRFSVNWARLMPEGVGKISEDGKRFYNELIDELLAAGITPWMTLFHWDYPYALYLKGGWLNADSPKWFEEYATVIAKLFGDRVKHFMTINEPQCFVELGHFSGGHAPFLRLSRREVLMAANNVLKASGMANRALRANIDTPISVGMAQVGSPILPYTEQDVELARKWMFDCHGNLFSPSFWGDPAVFGSFPEEFYPWFAENGYYPKKEDLALMKAEWDFYGLNIYTGDYVTEKDGRATVVTPKAQTPKTDMRWNVYPDSLYYGAKFTYERYGIPIIITENGVALCEWVDLDGKVQDSSRIDYIRRYLRALKRCAEDGTDVAGYFYWSFMDNFEWGEGFSKRFGLIYIDLDTKERIPKESAYWYGKTASENGENL